MININLRSVTHGMYGTLLSSLPDELNCCVKERTGAEDNQSI